MKQLRYRRVFTIAGIGVHDPGISVHDARNRCSGSTGISVHDGPEYAAKRLPLADVDVQTPETPVRFSLRLGVYLPSQVLQTHGCRCHATLASRIARSVTNSRAPWLRGRYPTSSLLPAHPTPSRLRPLSRFAGYTAYLAPPISRRDEEGLSSCLARPCHHAVDNHPAGVTDRIGPFRDRPCCLRQVIAGSASGASKFRGHLSFACATAW